MDPAEVMTGLFAAEETDALRDAEAEGAYVSDSPDETQTRPNHEDWLRQAH